MYVLDTVRGLLHAKGFFFSVWVRGMDRTSQTSLPSFHKASVTIKRTHANQEDPGDHSGGPFHFSVSSVHGFIIQAITGGHQRGASQGMRKTQLARVRQNDGI